MRSGLRWISRRTADLMLVGLVGLVQISCALAQSPQDRLEAAESALRGGRYEEARSVFEEVIASEEVDRGRVLRGLVEVLRLTGAYEEGIALLGSDRVAGIGRNVIDYLRGRLLIEVGRYQDAESAFASVVEADESDVLARFELGELLHATGRKRDAVDLYVDVYRASRANALTTAPEIAAAAIAASRIERFHEANELFETAHGLDREDADVLVAWGTLFARKFNQPDAQRTFQDGLNVNEHHPDLNAGFARAQSGFDAQETYAARAVDTNPNHVDALSHLAELRILDAQYEEAEALVDRALAVNPSAIEALANLASIHLLRADSTSYLVVERRALSINPSAGSFYTSVSENLARRFRYPDAAAVARRAVEVERDNPRVFAHYGAALFRVGQVQMARRYLEAAYDRDPFDLETSNTLTLIDEYAEFDILRSDHFELLIHQDERDVLGALILEEAEAYYADFMQRYPYRPAARMRIEAYNDHGDFSVRVGGIPHLGLLGVCFGDIVALDTPSAQQGENYNWARTLRHEIAHTMAIGVSDFRVPRWFTEGLSVYEEWRLRPEWYRKQDLELQLALDQDRLLPIATIDRGFTRPQFPGQIGLSYVHASRVIGYIVDRFGFASIVGILQRLQAGQAVNDALEEALGMSVDALDADFVSDLKSRRGEVAFLLKDAPDMLQEDADEKAAAGSHPFFEDLRRARGMLEADRLDEAEELLVEAIDRAPNWTRPGNAYELLAEVYRRKGDESGLARHLERYLTVTEYGGEEARELAGLLAHRGDRTRAVHYYRRSLELDPYHADTRQELGRLMAEAGRHERAVQEWQAVIALDPVDLSGPYYELARSLRATGRPAEAKRALLMSLERAPGFRDAQRLLLELVDANS